MRLFLLFFSILLLNYGLIAVPEQDSEPPVYESCLDASCSEGLECIYVTNYGKEPICISYEQACLLECYTTDCAILESYPAQIECTTKPEPPIDDGNYEPMPTEEKIMCKNEAGYCEIGAYSGFCECLNGQGVGWSEAQPGQTTDPEPVDGTETQEGDSDTGTTSTEDGQEPAETPTEAQCVEKLVEICGNEAPSLRDACTTSQLDDCVDKVSYIYGQCIDPLTEEEVSRLKNGEWIGESANGVYSCCKEYDTVKEKFAEMKTCIEENGCDECMEKDEPVEGETTTNPEDGTDNQGTGSSSSDDYKASDSAESDEKRDVSTGCSIITL